MIRLVSVLRRLGVAVVVLGLVLLAADRAAVVAASRLADRHAEHTGAATASVRILGFPFLTQAARGRLGHVTVSEHDLDGPMVRIDTLRLDAHGVHIPWGPALAGRITSVPVDAVTGTALVSYASLSSGIVRTLGLRAGLTVAVAPHGAGDLTVTLTGPLGLHLALTAPVPTVTDGRLQLGVFAQRFAAVLPDRVARALSLPLPTLPYGLRLGTATAEADGVHLAVSGRDVVVG